MRFWTLCLMFVMVGCGPSSDAPALVESTEFLDPVVVDGEHYKLEFENDSLRVLRENLAGGEGGAMHSHRARVSVYLKDAEVKLTPRGGETTRPSLPEPRPGASPRRTSASPNPTSRTSPSSSKSSAARSSTEVMSNATLVDAEHHVIEFENDWVRVVRMTYPAGETSSVHDHPPGFAVFISRARSILLRAA